MTRGMLDTICNENIKTQLTIEIQVKEDLYVVIRPEQSNRNRDYSPLAG